MRLIDADAMNEELFYKQVGGKDSSCGAVGHIHNKTGRKKFRTIPDSYADRERRWS